MKKILFILMMVATMAISNSCTKKPTPSQVQEATYKEAEAAITESDSDTMTTRLDHYFIDKTEGLTYTGGLVATVFTQAETHDAKGNVVVENDTLKIFRDVTIVFANKDYQQYQMTISLAE